ncbi:MAG TPA: TolC family protein [Polyangiaceae bacterium]
MLGRTTRFVVAGGCALLLPRLAGAAGPPPAVPPAPPSLPPATPAPVAPATMAAPAAGPATIVPAGPTMSLQDAVQLALSRNERAKISDLNVVVADAAVERAFAGFMPLVTMGGTDTQHAYASTSTTPNNVGTANLTVNQPLLNASLFPLYSQAKELANAQRSQNVDDKRLLAFAGATAFFTVLNAQEVVAAAQRALDNSRANLADTQARAQAGLNSSNDVTRAQVDMTGAVREVEADKGTLDNAYVQLAFTVNAPVPASVVPPAATLAVAQQGSGVPDPLVRFALDHRPDVLVAKYQASAAHDFADEPMMRLIPTVGLQGVAQTSNALPGGRTTDELLQGTLTWTVFDQGVRYADKHSRDAQADIAELNLKLLDRSVDAQVRSAVALLASAQAAFRAAGESSGFARQNVEETAILYRQGLAKAIELVDANDSRFTAEVNLSSAEFTMAQAYLGLRQALGLEPLGTELK